MDKLLKNADTADKLKKSGLTVLAEGPYADVSKNPDVVEAYMGTVH